MLPAWSCFTAKTLVVSLGSSAAFECMHMQHTVSQPLLALCFGSTSHVIGIYRHGSSSAGGPPPPEPPPKDELKHFLPFMMDMMPIAPTPTLLRMFKGPIPLTYDEFLSVQDEVRSGTSKMVSHSHHSADSRRKRSRSRERSG